jgi:hypothetical protein
VALLGSFSCCSNAGTRPTRLKFAAHALGQTPPSISTSGTSLRRACLLAVHRLHNVTSSAPRPLRSEKLKHHVMRPTEHVVVRRIQASHFKCNCVADSSAQVTECRLYFTGAWTELSVESSIVGCIYDDEYSGSFRRDAVMMVIQRLQLITTRGLMVDDVGNWPEGAEQGLR